MSPTPSPGVACTIDFHLGCGRADWVRGGSADFGVLGTS